MLNKLKLTKRSQGFTIVELLVVIVVVGILAAVTLVGYTGVTQRAAAAALETDLKNASTALEIYKTDNGDYPPEGSAAVTSLPKSDGTTYQYTVSGGQYYLSATSPTAGTVAFYVSSTTGSVVSGVWSGHTLPGSTGWKQVASGYRHTCAIDSNDSVYCWGSNQFGELGNNSSTSSSIPVSIDASGVLSGKTIKYMAVGPSHTCVIASDDKAYCWGSNGYGNLGNNSTTDSHVPVAVDTAGVLSGKTVKTLTAGSDNTCAIASDDKAYCWGGNGYGDLGNNLPDTQSLVPVAVSTTGALNGKTIKYIATGNDYHTCAIASDDLAYCWGYNNAGQLGNNSLTDSPVPIAVNTAGVLSGKTVKSLSVGAGGRTCAIASDNKAYCWGSNNVGQLGDNSTNDSSVPVAVSTAGVLSGKTINSISAGSNHTCAVASDNNAYCWGFNSNGQLGNNSSTYSSVPVAVSTAGVLSGKTISTVSAGGAHSCAVASDNQAYCWGQNGYNDMMDGDVIYGQLGNNSTDLKSLIPVAVSQI